MNDAINQLHIQDGNHKALKKSIDEFNEFDLHVLASQLENHPSLEFRRISAYLFKVGKKWERAMAISKKDNLWSDTMETTADSGSPDMAEELLTFFVKEDKKECFAACLYICFELIRPDVVLELAWRHGLMDYAMPFMIQSFRDFDTQIKQLNSKFKTQEDASRTEEEKKKKSDEEEQRGAASYVGISGNFNPLIMPLALPPPTGAYGAPNSFGPPVGNFGPPVPFGGGMPYPKYP